VVTQVGSARRLVWASIEHRAKGITQQQRAVLRRSKRSRWLAGKNVPFRSPYGVSDPVEAGLGSSSILQTQPEGLRQGSLAPSGTFSFALLEEMLFAKTGHPKKSLVISLGAFFSDNHLRRVE